MPGLGGADAGRRSTQGGAHARITACLTAAGCLLGRAVLAYRPAAAANVSEVLIGDLLPLPGNFASLGQQDLWAAQTVEDNRHLRAAELGKIPCPSLGPVRQNHLKP